MRARGLFLALALVASACSSSATPENASPSSDPNGVSDQTTTANLTVDGQSSSSDEVESAGRQLGEPADQSDLGDPDLDDADFGTAPDGVAFKEPARSDGATTDPLTPTEATSPPEVPQSGFDRLVSDLIVFVENERGYSFQSRPSVELLDGPAFGAAWSELIAKDVAENSIDYVNYTDIYRAMGIIDGDRNLEEIWQRFGDAGVIGYYDPDTGNIKLRAGEVNAFTETVLVHELVHALEDQIFGLDRPEYSNGDDEREWTFSALSEGSARRIEAKYRATFSSAKRGEETEARRALPRAVSLTEFNTSFLELQFGRYRYGEAFATTLWAQGKGTLDTAFEQPPTTSEAILDPNGFLSGSTTNKLEAPPADGDVFETGVWGQAGWAAILADLTSQADALAIADGWNGDAFVAWREGDRACVRTHIAGDSPDELDEYAAALEEWSFLAEGREIFYPTADFIRVTACR